MRYFNIEKIHSDEQAIQEMEEQYSYLTSSNTTSARKNRCDNMIALYEHFPILHKLWRYIKCAKQYIKKFVRKVAAAIAEFAREKREEFFYIMRFYDRKGRWLWDKVGSTYDIDKRMGEHLRYYKDACSVETLYSISTGEVSASSLEDNVRDYLIRKLGRENFKPKDRFLAYIDIEDIKAKVPACLESLRNAIII